MDIDPALSIPDVCIPTRLCRHGSTLRLFQSWWNRSSVRVFRALPAWFPMLVTPAKCKQLTSSIPCLHEDNAGTLKKKKNKKNKERRMSHRPDDVSIVGRRRWVPSLTRACRVFVRIRLDPPLLLSFLLKQGGCMDTVMEQCRSQVIKYQSSSHGYLNAEIILVMTE